MKSKTQHIMNKNCLLLFVFKTIFCIEMNYFMEFLLKRTFCFDFFLGSIKIHSSHYLDIQYMHEKPRFTRLF